MHLWVPLQKNYERDLLKIIEILEYMLCDSAVIFCKFASWFIHRFDGKIYGYSKNFRFLKNYKIPLICRTDITLLKTVIQKVSFLFYRLIIIMKISISMQIFPQMPMCLFSQLF